MKILIKLFLFATGASLLIIASYYILHFYQEPKRLNNDTLKEATGSFINLSQGRTHYQFYGRDEDELIILIHGGGATGRYVWSKNIPALVDAGYRVLCYDLYGRGYSDYPYTTYDPDLIYNQFTELLDSLAIKDSFYLFGQSMGAMPATIFAAKFPKRIKKLVYVAPSILGGYSAKWYLKTPILSNLLMTFYWYPQSLSSQIAEFYNADKAQDYKIKLKHFMKFQGYKRVNLSTWLYTNTVSLKDQLTEVGNTNLPVLLILGKNDPYIPYQSEKIYSEAIPIITSHIIEESGHLPHYENPEEVNAAILKFLK